MEHGADQANYWLRSWLSRRTALGGAGMGLSALTLAACGTSKSSTSKATTNAAPTGAKAASATATGGAASVIAPAASATANTKQPKPGGSFSFQITTAPPSLDPYTQTSFLCAYVNGLSYSRLLRFRNGVAQYAPTDFTMEPDLAAAMPETPDPQRLVFKLKPAKYQNVAPVNGRDVTSEDVRYAIDRYAHYEKSVHQSIWNWLDSIETPDKQTVVLKSQFPYADAVLVTGGAGGSGLAAYISPKELAETDAAATKMAGSGPFILTEFLTGTSLTFKKNPDYYDKPYPYFDEVKAFVVTDQAKRLADFSAKSVDLTFYFFAEERDQLKRQRPEARFETVPFPGRYIYLRTDKPPFNDKRVRQALSMAIDRKAIREAVSKGEGDPDQIVFVGFPDWAHPVKDLGAAAKYWDYNPQAAKQLLQAAGVDNLSVQWTHADASVYLQSYIDHATLTQAQWKQIGITVQDVQQPYAQYIGTTYQGQYEGIAHSPKAVPGDIDYLSERLSFRPKRGRINLSYVNNPAIDDLLDKQRGEFNNEARKKIVTQIEAICAEEQYEIYWSTDTRTYFWNPDIENYRPSAFFPYTHLMKSWRST